MVISGTLAIIATTVSLFGAVNTGANLAGAYQDKQLIQDSLNNMKATEQLLRQKANDSSGANQQEMMVAANKLSQVNSKMTELNNQIFSNSIRREGLGFAKGLVTGKAASAAEIGKLAENLVGIGDAAADQIVGNNGLQGTLDNMAIQDWNAAAQAGDELDVQILILQARELTKRTKALNKDMQQLQSWYQQEAPGNTDTADVDQQVAQLVNNNPELYQQLQAQTQLKGSDSSQPDVAVDDSSIDQEPDLEPASKETQVNRSVIGTWVGTDKRLDFEVGAMNGTDRDGNLVEKVLHFKEGGVLDREDKPLDGGVDYSWEQVDADHVKTIVDYEGLHYEITYKLEGDKLISTKVFAGFNGETSENNDVYAKQVLKRSQ
jgi:hypothetical protein